MRYPMPLWQSVSFDTCNSTYQFYFLTHPLSNLEQHPCLYRVSCRMYNVIIQSIIRQKYAFLMPDRVVLEYVLSSGNMYSLIMGSWTPLWIFLTTAHRARKIHTTRAVVQHVYMLESVSNSMTFYASHLV